MKVVIDLGAYRRNLRTLSQLLAPSVLMAVVKDDAYGHGRDRLVDVALEEGIRHFAVLDPETGVGLRARGVDPQVMLLAWLFHPSQDFSDAVAHRVDLGISDIRALERVVDAATAVGSPGRVHLKVDSGLHRNGADPADWAELVARAKVAESEGHVAVVGIWTHIGEASDADDDESQAVFEAAVQTALDQGVTAPVRHLAASAAAFARPEFRYDLARVGGFTFGVAPGSGVHPEGLGLEPVMSARARVVDVGEESGRTHAVIDAGYLDGLPAWNVPSVAGITHGLPRAGFEVVIRGRRHPILRVASDHIVSDITEDAAALRAGDEAILFGSHLRGEPVLQEWADATGTVGEEIVVRVGRGSERQYVD